MKTRQIELLRLLLNHETVNVNEIKDLYDISIRTLYYDIEQINYLIVDYGNLRIEESFLIFEGDATSLCEKFERELLTPYFESRERQDLILLSILDDEQLTLEEYSEKFKVSKTTIYSDIETLKNELLDKKITLYYKSKYLLDGSEWSIRDCYLNLLKYKEFSFFKIDKKIINFNKKEELNLSDYSMFYLSEFVSFLNNRFSQNKYLNCFFNGLDINIDLINLDVSNLIHTNNKFEKDYLKAYVLSYTGLKNIDEKIFIDKYVEKLLNTIRIKLALDIKWTNSFKQNLTNHLSASYYRIAFSFPASNPSLNDIKIRYFSLYNNTKKIIRSLPFMGFNKMREAEIGFVTAYIGGYMERYHYINNRQLRLILVCPQGRAVSNYLKHQIENLSDKFEIVGSYSIDRIGKLLLDYDFIVTTVDLPHFKNVIKVNPMLSISDRTTLLKLLSSRLERHTKVEEILEIIKKYSSIHDEQRLEKELSFILNDKYDFYTIRRQPMLSELLTHDRILKLKKVDNWEEGIKQASKPLLDDGSIDSSYVDAMISSVNEFGPYIVLADEFALPHASNSGGVNQLSMSMLILEEPVDMKGEQVKIFMVLATVDNKSHLKALSSLTDLISNEENLQWFKEAEIDEIVKFIQEKEVGR